MKYLSIRLPFFLIILLFAACAGKSKVIESGNTNAKFKVWGNCDMCKETIEAGLKVQGISRVNWDVDTKQIEVDYDSTKISLDQIQKTIAASGYDTEKYKADEQTYNNLPECCQYNRNE